MKLPARKKMYLCLHRVIVIGIFLLGAACQPAPVSPLPSIAASNALPHSMKGYELYSWQTNGDWNFTLITGTNRIKSIDEITAHEDSVTDDGWVKITVWGIEAIKTVLGQLPTHESIFWAGAPGSGSLQESILTLPPQEMIAALQEYCQVLNLELRVSQW
jgi:hypothetical protein